MNYQTKTKSYEFKNLEATPLVYFCSEYGITDELPIYAGGLGVLAGDYVMEAGEQGVPMIAIGLLYQNGPDLYHDPIDTQTQEPIKQKTPEELGFLQVRKEDSSEPLLLNLEIEDRVVYLRVWEKAFESVRLFLLDCNFDANQEEDRNLFESLYPHDREKQMIQDVALSVCGVKLLRKLKVTPSIYHLNEGHTALVPLALAAEYLHDNAGGIQLIDALDNIRPQIVASKHTILPGSGLYFTKDQLKKVLGAYLARHKVALEDFWQMGLRQHDPDYFSTTRFLINTAIRANGVSITHTLFEKRRYPNSQLIPITNGIHKHRWISPRFPEEGIGQLSDEELWHVHQQNKTDLANFVQKTTGAMLNQDSLTVVWARRLAGYKRPSVIFSDIKRLKKIVLDKNQPTTIIIAGRAAQADEVGIKFVQEMHKYISEEDLTNHVIYIPAYSLADAEYLTRGADVWLNTPEKGKEACGTSGMKAGINGALQFTVSDGWVAEVDMTDKGWVLSGSEVTELYDILEKEVAPLFYKRNERGVPSDWVMRMRNIITTVENNYTATRMLEEYLNRLYFPGMSMPYKLFHR